MKTNRNTPLLIIAAVAMVLGCDQHEAKGTAGAGNQFNLTSFSINVGGGNGAVQFLTNWFGKAWAWADGAADFHSNWLGAVGATAHSAFSQGDGTNSAGWPPSFAIIGKADSSSVIPSPVQASAASWGRSTLANAFQVTGG
jgi:hypothetical protein